MLRPPFLAALILLTSLGTARPADPAERPHELGWVCINVSDVGVSQISAFNKDSPSLTIWVPKARFHVDPTGPGTAGRICVPAVVRLGDGALPPETLVFERTVLSGNVHRPSIAELVVTPESPLLSEVTVEMIGVAEQWTQRDDTLTFQLARPIQFPERTSRGLIGDGEGPPPPGVFAAVPATDDGLDEPCQPVVLEEAVVASFGHFEERAGTVVARGIEPYRLDAETHVARCEGLALDTMMVAVARAAATATTDSPDSPGDTVITWYLVPRTTRMRPLDAAPPDGGGRRFSAEHPLGGYHVCRQPTWSTSILVDVPMSGTWELQDGGRWQQNLPGDAGAAGTLTAGSQATLLDHRDSWALVRAKVDGRDRVIAAPASSVAMPSGPAQGAITYEDGLCPVRRGLWKAVKANAQTFKVAQDTPGAELAGLWLEIPMGTHVLQLCQDGAVVGGKTIPGVPACEPIIVGGTRGSETEPFVLVRYAGTLLAVRARDLRDKTTGEFELRRERPWYYQADKPPEHDDVSGWALALGPGGRISFLRPDDHAWTVSLGVQRLVVEGVGFEGGFGAGGDGHGIFLTVSGGFNTLLTALADASLELRAGALGLLDLRVSDDGGLDFNVLGKLQLRWVNDYVPVSLEAGINFGYGGTFGNETKGGVRFGIPIRLMIELVQF